MRKLCFLFLVVFVAAIAGFAYYNQQEVTLRFWEWSTTASLALLIAAAYGLGMLSGWTVVGMLRRSLYRVAERPAVRGSLSAPQ